LTAHKPTSQEDAQSRRIVKEIHMATARSIRTGACAALLLLAAGAARAQAHSSAGIENFGYELVDLDPADGVTPSLTLTLTDIYGETDLYLGSFSYPTTQASTNTFGKIHVENAYGSGSAALAPDYSSSSAVDTEAYSARSGTRLDLQFDLSPHTRVIFSAGAAVSAQPVHGFTYAEAGLHGEITTPFISHGTRFDAVDYTYLGDESGVLSVVANAGEATTTGTLSIRTSASSESFTPPVPEPPAVAMLGGGLVLVAGAPRRRRARTLTASA
jgi:hypothetical protein